MQKNSLTFDSPWANDIRYLYDEASEATKKLKSCFSSYDYFQITHPYVPILDEFDRESIENKHTISLVIVDDMAQDVAARCVTRPPIEVISSRCDT